MPGHNDWYSVNLDPFSIDFSPYPFKEMSFHDACDHTARLIADKFDNLYLAFSGGYDSELVANVLLRNKIPFTPFIWKDCRSKETDFALHWCRKNNIIPRVYEGDVLDIKLRKILKKTAASFNSIDGIGSLAVMLAKIIDKENGHLITGDGIVISSGIDYPNPMSLQTNWLKSEFFVDLLRPKHPGSFFLHTPEILLSYAKEVDKSLPTQEAKAILYELNFRPKILPYHAWLEDENKVDASGEKCSTGSIDELISHLSQFKLDTIEDHC